MITIDEIMEALGMTRDQEAATRFGRSIQAISNWRRDGIVPASIERMFRDMIGNGNVAIHGDGHHIDVHHVSDPGENYSPTLAALIDLVKAWPDKKTRQLFKIAMEMDERNGEG